MELSIPVWKCQDGRRIPVIEMTDDHIKNCIAMLRRNGRISRDDLGPFPNPPCMQGEYAQMCAEYEWGRACDDWTAAAVRVSAWFEIFEKELKRRGYQRKEE